MNERELNERRELDERRELNERLVERTEALLRLNNEEWLAEAIEIFVGNIPREEGMIERDWSSLEMARFIMKKAAEKE